LSFKYNCIKSIKSSPAGLLALQGFLQNYFISGRLAARQLYILFLAAY